MRPHAIADHRCTGCTVPVHVCVPFYDFHTFLLPAVTARLPCCGIRPLRYALTARSCSPSRGARPSRARSTSLPMSDLLTTCRRRSSFTRRHHLFRRPFANKLILVLGLGRAHIVCLAGAAFWVLESISESSHWRLNNRWASKSSTPHHQGPSNLLRSDLSAPEDGARSGLRIPLQVTVITGVNFKLTTRARSRSGESDLILN